MRNFPVKPNDEPEHHELSYDLALAATGVIEVADICSLHGISVEEVEHLSSQDDVVHEVSRQIIIRSLSGEIAETSAALAINALVTRLKQITADPDQSSTAVIQAGALLEKIASHSAKSLTRVKRAGNLNENEGFRVIINMGGETGNESKKTIIDATPIRLTESAQDE